MRPSRPTCRACRLLAGAASCFLVALVFAAPVDAAPVDAAAALPPASTPSAVCLIDPRPSRADSTYEDEGAYENGDYESEDGDLEGVHGEAVEPDEEYPSDEYPDDANSDGVGPDDESHAVPIKIVLYGLRVVPTGRDAQDYSRAGWGGGGKVTASIGPLARIGAFGLGFEVVNLLSRTREFRDPRTQLRVEQQTSQNLHRLYLGPEIGAHGHGFIRPYAGANLAVSFHNIHTDVVIPNDSDPANEIRQSLDSDGDSSLGYDLNLGADLNFRGLLVDGGVRFLKSFGVPQQLGLEAERIHPAYFQVYVGVGIDLNAGAERWID